MTAIPRRRSGRPFVPADRKLSTVLGVRLRDAEYAALAALAARHGRPISEEARTCLLRHLARQRPPAGQGEATDR